MTDPRRRAGLERPDLTEIQATDALLDRLGARAANDQDLDDPLTALLVTFTREVDEGAPGVPDLSDLRARAAAAASDDADGAGAGGSLVELSRVRALIRRPRSADGVRLHGRRRADGAVAMPRSVRTGSLAAVVAGAATVLALGAVALSSGPTGPVTGVGGVISGVTHDDDRARVAAAVDLVEQAREAMSQGRRDEAGALLQQARAKLDTLGPQSTVAAQADVLRVQIEQVAEEVEPAASAGTTASTTPQPAASASPVATASPGTGTGTVTTSPTATSDTTDPTTTPTGDSSTTSSSSQAAGTGGSEGPGAGAGVVVP